ncbi:hypothetical protein GCM10011323_23800 [Pontibacter amylolyticus]|uniref:Uncharacterized protein n=1 Tax=Pontibacter amylolyticus TaxID=1424080 RepID=A0ABQ1W7V9_9BACT|nr:hypothetical protein GCM10011323_23800 [Pontibacter amylolyticus]
MEPDEELGKLQSGVVERLKYPTNSSNLSLKQDMSFQNLQIEAIALVGSPNKRQSCKNTT